MSSINPMRKDLFKIVGTALVSLFLIPSIAYLFILYALPIQDAFFQTAIEQNIKRNKAIAIAEKRGRVAAVRATPPSTVCGVAELEPVDYREWVCTRFSVIRQYLLVKQIAAATLIAGVLVLLVIAALGAIAFVNRRWQYVSFVVGWRFLTLANALGVVVQGALLVWLSVWVYRFFAKSFNSTLVWLAVSISLMVVFYAIVCIFKRPPQDTGIEGEVIAKADAPALWGRIRALSGIAKTAPPEHVVAGIDTNFFVTEASLQVGEKTLRGRTLFVSLPLLRLLDQQEADAVLAHELAHFRGGDTASSALLGPKLTQYDNYCEMMYSHVVTITVFYVLRLYRVIFEFALKRDSRAREFLADNAAASLVSASAIITCLIKIGAYARYRGEIEQKLFDHNRRLTGDLGIAASVAGGLAPYAASAQFLDSMQAAGIPHPFDSHPALRERMLNVGHEVSEQDYSSIVTTTPAKSWIQNIPHADAIEQRLWAAYETRFAESHEHSLAYRYLPATDEERAIVLRHFPPLEFSLRGGKRIEVNYSGLVLPKTGELLPWNSIKAFEYENGFGSDRIKVTHPEKTLVGAKKSTIKLPGIRKERERLENALVGYWQRHYYAIQVNEEREVSAQASA